jgi:hypothetical protein
MDSDLEYLIPTTDYNDYEIISKYLIKKDEIEENIKRSITRLVLKIKYLIPF